MDSNKKNLNDLKQDYYTHAMSERQVSEMKNKINQAKKTDRNSNYPIYGKHHLPRPHLLY